MAGGRPTDFREEYCELATNYCILGATDKELAQFFEVSEVTINAWKSKFPEFINSIKRGRQLADANVGKRLYERAMGYEHKEDVIMQYQGVPVIVETTKHYPPDTGACIFWLKNRRPDKWRDKQEIEVTEIPTIKLTRKVLNGSPDRINVSSTPN